MASIYQQYTYSYPHKHAFRAFNQATSITEAWKNEAVENLFAYLHIPYCEMRCGFCNLFTVANPKEGINAYLAAIKREAAHYRDASIDFKFEEYAIGGGTPTFLSERELENMLGTFKNVLGVDTHSKYGSIEASPKSINAEKISIIEDFGITRLSMGVQSWLEEETKLLGRPQSIQEVTKAVELIKNSKVPEFNLDLIYGIHSQTTASWLYSIEKTLAYQPTEIFLYPLYTRPLTGLAKMQNGTSDNRQKLYRIGRDFLLKNGYYQTSMRCFRKDDANSVSNNYKTAEDGMVGIGAGARSYTQDLHYSTDYAVGRKETKAIIAAYSTQHNFEEIAYGMYLDQEEQKRRFIIKSLIDGGSLDTNQYKRVFNTDSIPYIDFLFEKDWLVETNNMLSLNLNGMEMEDLIGPMLFSEKTKKSMSEFVLV